MMRPRKYVPTPAKPIVAYMPPGGGMPVALNPMQARALMGELPGVLELGRCDFYDGIAGLGRFAMETALEDSLAPRTNLGQLGAQSPADTVASILKAGESLMKEIREAEDAGKRISKELREVFAVGKRAVDKVKKFTSTPPEQWDEEKKPAAKQGWLKRWFKRGKLSGHILAGAELAALAGVARIASRAPSRFAAHGAVATLGSMPDSEFALVANDWRPTLGEYALGCACQATRDDLIRNLARGAKLGAFDLAGNKQAAQLHAASFLGLCSTPTISAEQAAQVGALGNVFEDIARGASQLFQQVQRTPVGSALINAGQQLLNDVFGRAQRANVAYQQSTQQAEMLRQIKAERERLDQLRQTPLPIATKAAADEGVKQYAAKQAELEKQLAISQKEAAEARAALEEAKRKAAPVVAEIRQEAAKAETNEKARVAVAEKLEDSGALKGQVMLMSKTEYAEHVRRSASAEAARDKAQALAKQLAAKSNALAQKLATQKISELALKSRIAELENQLKEFRTSAEVAVGIEGEKRQLLEQLNRMRDQFAQELQRARQTSAEQVARVSDVVNQSGIQAMFDLLRQMTASMRDIKDVTHAGEFLQLFPRVLEQLKLAQEIASPEKPEVTVNVPQSPAPVVNVSPPNFQVTPSFQVMPPNVEVREGNITVQLAPGESRPAANSPAA